MYTHIKYCTKYNNITSVWSWSSIGAKHFQQYYRRSQNVSSTRNVYLQYVRSISLYTYMYYMYILIIIYEQDHSCPTTSHPLNNIALIHTDITHSHIQRENFSHVIYWNSLGKCEGKTLRYIVHYTVGR